MQHISNIPQDQILSLREAASIIRGTIYALERKTFCTALKSYVKELSSLTDNLDQTCVENLLTDEEFEQNLKCALEEKRYQAQTESDYYASVL